MWNVDEMKRLECLDIVFEIIFFLYVNFVWKNDICEKDLIGMLSLFYKFYVILYNMLKIKIWIWSCRNFSKIYLLIGYSVILKILIVMYFINNMYVMFDVMLVINKVDNLVM